MHVIYLYQLYCSGFCHDYCLRCCCIFYV